MRMIYCIILLLPLSAAAQCVTQTVGGVSYHRCSDGVHGTTLQDEFQTYTRLSDGRRITTVNGGDITIHNDSGDKTLPAVPGPQIPKITGKYHSIKREATKNVSSTSEGERKTVPGDRQNAQRGIAERAGSDR